MHLLKTILIACITYILLFTLVKLLFTPVLSFHPEISTNDRVKIVVSRLSYCESRNNPNAYVHDDGGSPSAGILQFKKYTFYNWWKRLVNPDFELSDASNLWMDATSQRYLAQKMIETDWNNWTNWSNCGKAIGLREI